MQRVKRSGIIFTAFLLVMTVVFNSVQTAFAATLNNHSVALDASGKIIPWNANNSNAYDYIVSNAWNYLINQSPNGANGLKAYYSYSYINPDTQQTAGWPHNPAGLNAMLTESALKTYRYSGDMAPVTLASNLLSYHLDHGMTAVGDNWSHVPYASADAGATTYGGASYGNSTGVGDGTGVIEPDKVGEEGLAFVRMYDFNGTTRYRDAAIDAANALASHVRTGNATQSPWPFRVVAATNVVKQDYTANVIPAIELFDELIRLNLGNVASYQTARATAWNWMMTYPMQNNIWDGYFEDVANDSTLTNRNQLTAGMTARYLLEHPEYDPNWETHVRGIINWIEQTFGVSEYGATTIREQQAFMHVMGSHTSRYASLNALLYEKTGDTAAKEKAYRAFNWATYMERTNGVVIDGPTVNNQWFTDGYGDYIRHFVTGMGAVPAWAPDGQSHVLDSSRIVRNVAYSANQVDYTSGDQTASEKLKLAFVPGEVTVGTTTIPQLTAIPTTGEGWYFDAAQSVLYVRHTSGSDVHVISSGLVGNVPPSVNLISPTGGTTYSPTQPLALSATASDSDGTVSKVEFIANNNVVGTVTTAPYNASWSGMAVGNYTLYARATDNSGAVTNSAAVSFAVDQTLPSPWQKTDIGSVGVAGTTTYDNNVFTVKGSGVDIWDANDSFHYAYQPLSGDGQIIARVASQQNTDPWALAGVMIRESLTSGSRHAIAAITPSNGYSLTSRSTTGAASAYVSGGNGGAPGWLKLVRSGNAITAYRSADGIAWTQFGTVNLAMSGTIYIGLAVTSHSNSTLATDTFSSVQVTQSADTVAPSLSAISAGSINQNGATIQWTTNEASDSQIEYGPTTSFGFSTALNTTMSTSHTLAVSGLDAATTYYYRVKSRDAAGNLAVSATQTFNTPTVPDGEAPTSPANLQQTMPQFGQIGISWDASTDNIGVVGYKVMRNGVQIATTAATSYVDATVAPQTTYTYSVYAYDASNNVSTASSSVTVESLPDTVAPTAPANLAATTTATSATLTWGASTDNVAVAGYDVFRNGTKIGSTTTQLQYVDNGLTTGTAYSYYVVARDAASNASTASSTINVTPIVVANPLTVQAMVNRQQNTSATTIVSPNLTTTSPNTLLVAFIASDGPNGAQSIKTVTGGGLTWTMRKRANTQRGTSEIWTAPAAATVTNLAVTATRNSGSYQGSMTVVAFAGADTSTIGATASTNASTGAASLNLTTTRANSWVWGMGNDWDGANARVVPTGQTKVDEFLAPAGDTFWLQRLTNTTPTSGTNVTLNTTAPTNHRWNFVGIEILPTL